MLKRSSSASGREAAAAAASPGIDLPTAHPLWLNASPTDRYLLLEDPDTGDVLMPLIYMKAILEANYSRKLAALKHREVAVPQGNPLADKAGLLHWQWAFEAPQPIKALVRRELGDDNAPQGHLRLVLVPIVYNALAGRDDMHALPLFRALHAALRRSTYWPLLIPPVSSVLEQLDAETDDAQKQGTGDPEPLFAGPHTFEASANKYMFCFRDASEVEQSKKARTTGLPLKQDGVRVAEAGSTRGREAEQAGGSGGGRATATASESTAEVAEAGQSQQPAVVAIAAAAVGGSQLQLGDQQVQAGVVGVGQLPAQAGGQQAAERLSESQMLLLAHVQVLVQQELLPFQQQMCALAEEVSSLKRAIQHIWTQTAPPAQGPTGTAAGLLPAAQQRTLPPEAPQVAMQAEEVLNREPSPSGMLEQQINMQQPQQQQQQQQQQLGAARLPPLHLSRAPQSMQQRRLVEESGQGRDAPGASKQAQQLPQRDQVPRGSAAHLLDSLPASLQDLFGSRNDDTGVPRPPSSMAPTPSGGRDGLGWVPRSERHRASSAMAGSGSGGMLLTDCDGVHDALAAATEVLAHAAAINVLGTGRGEGGSNGVRGGAEMLRPPGQALRHCGRAGEGGGDALDWQALLSNLGPSGLGAALEMLSQPPSMPRAPVQPAAGAKLS